MELNISCPTVGKGGLQFAIDEDGADALSAINKLSGMALRADRTGPFLGNTYGGLSGPAIKPVALRIVYEVAQVVGIPVIAVDGGAQVWATPAIAVGGVTGLDDVLDSRAAGAVAVQVGTAIFAAPTLPA